MKENPYSFTGRFSDTRYLDKPMHDAWEEGYAACEAQHGNLLAIVKELIAAKSCLDNPPGGPDSARVASKYRAWEQIEAALADMRKEIDT